MKNKLITLVLTLCIFQTVSAQETPVSAEIAINNVRATINSDGTLFNNLNDDSGQFLIEAENSTLQSTLKKSGIWIAGTDQAGNAIGSFMNQNNNQENSFIPFDGLNKIWRVTKQDIVQHRADFADNGVIDQVNENIFAWPGFGNPHFQEYNPGLIELPKYLRYFGVAEYWSEDNDNTYDPLKGDFPLVGIRGFSHPIIPDEALFMIFNDKDLGLDLPNFNAHIRCSVFAYKCEENNPINNTVFVKYNIAYIGPQKIDNLHMGILNDFQIGAESDEYFGSIPSENITYAYNGDNIDAGGFEEASPVMAFQLLSGPIVIDIDTAIAINTKFIKPIQEFDELSGLESYSLLKGKNPDGTTDTNPDFLFAGDPNITNSDSEVTANTLPGKRQVISSFGPISFSPGSANELFVAYTTYQEPGNTALENVDLLLNEQLSIVKDFFESGFDRDNICSETSVNTNEVISTDDIKVTPNISADLINFTSNGSKIKSFQLVGLNGQLLLSKKWTQAISTHTIDVSRVESGMYVLQILSEDGKYKNEKIIVLE